jgi:predicted enzyme related to lactoylglutathione lyase
VAVLHGIVVDSVNPARVSMFWQAVLGWSYRRKEHDWHSLENPGGGPHLSFGTVPEDKTVKNRVHIDIRPAAGITMDEERERLEQLGATTRRLVTDNPADVHYIMADPEGNEFCLLGAHLS